MDKSHYTGKSLWSVSQLPYDNFIIFGNANHSSWCNTSNSINIFMNPFVYSAGGVHGGTQASQVGCNDQISWKDNFSWQVYTR